MVLTKTRVLKHDFPVHGILHLFLTTVTQQTPALRKNEITPVTPRRRVKRYAAEIAALSTSTKTGLTEHVFTAQGGTRRFNLQENRREVRVPVPGPPTYSYVGRKRGAELRVEDKSFFA